ncbi:CDP-diacylglycerol--serine O-phosphatidyltransferase, partial [Pseudomonas poae]|nr:CDP-diacylglycerol--serine O-phosphatidyltransferase [Pseudomonas poae]
TQGQWLARRALALEQSFQHTTRIGGYQHLQTLVDYPAAVGKFLRRVSRVRIERLLYRIL